MRDQLCDIISYRACSCGIGKISVHNKIVIENQKREKGWRLEHLFYKFPSKTMYVLAFIACLLQEGTDVICCTHIYTYFTHIASLRLMHRSGCHKLGHAQNI